MPLPQVKVKKVFLNSITCDIIKKAKVFLVFAIIAVLLISVFAFLPKGNVALPDVPQNTDAPNASPSDTAGNR